MTAHVVVIFAIAFYSLFGGYFLRTPTSRTARSATL